MTTFMTTLAVQLHAVVGLFAARTEVRDRAVGLCPSEVVRGG
ncbi:hypothetical protein [Streptomyces sp. NPDC059479]